MTSRENKREVVGPGKKRSHEKCRKLLPKDKKTCVSKGPTILLANFYTQSVMIWNLKGATSDKELKFQKRERKPF